MVWGAHSSNTYDIKQLCQGEKEFWPCELSLVWCAHYPDHVMCKISCKIRSTVTCHSQLVIFLTLANPQCNERASGPNPNNVFSSV